MHIGPSCNCSQSLLRNSHAWLLPRQVVSVARYLVLKAFFLRRAEAASYDAFRSEQLVHLGLRIGRRVELVAGTCKLVYVFLVRKLPLVIFEMHWPLIKVREQIVWAELDHDEVWFRNIQSFIQIL